MTRKTLLVRLTVTSLTAFCLTFVGLQGPKRAFAMLGGSKISSSGQIRATTKVEDHDEVYALDEGNNSIIVSDLQTGTIKAVLSLSGTLGNAVDMSQNLGGGDVVFVTDGGGLYGVDSSTHMISTLLTMASATFGPGVVADNHSPSDDAAFTDTSTGNLMIAGSAGPRIAMALPGSGDVKDMFETDTPTGGTGSKMGGAQRGSAIVFTYDRDTLATQDAAYASVSLAGAAYAGGDDYFVTVMNGSTGELLQFSLNAATFGFVFPPLRTFTDATMDVAFDNGVLAVATGTSSPAGTQLHVYDFGDGASLLDVGILDASTSVPSVYNLTIHIDDDYQTIDNLIYVMPSAGQDASIGSIGGQEEDFAWASSATLTGDAIGLGETGGAHASHSAHYCDTFLEDTEVEGPCVERATPLKVDFATGEEIYVHPLFSVPGIGLDLDVVLTYRSQRDHDYRYGRGWYLNHDTRMRTEANGDETYRNGFGLYEVYAKNGASYAPPHNFDTTLTVTAGARTVTNRFGTVTQYDAAGKRTSQADRYGNTISYTWTGDQLTKITDTRGKDTTLSYGSDGRLSSIVDYGGRTWTFSYDYRGRLTSIQTPASVQQPNGRTHRFSYSRNHATAKLADNLVHVWSPKGDIVQSLAYDDNDFVTKETVGPGAWAISYDLPNSQTTTVDPSGNTVRWTFDSSGYLISEERFTKGLRPGEPTSFTKSYEYGAVSNLVEAVVHPRGNREEYAYSAVFDLLETRRKETNTPSSSSSDLVVTHQYGAFSQRTQTTDERGNVTTFTLDANGNTTQITRPSVTSPAAQSVVETFTYDAQGRVLMATDGAGRVTTFSYYASGTQAGWLASVTRDPTGLALTTSFSYNPYGSIVSVTNPRGHTTTFTVDAENYITQIQAPSPLNYKTKFSFDENGNLVKKEVENRDRKGALDPTTPWITTNYSYNAVGWRETKTEQLTASVSAVTTYEYQANGLVSKVINAENEQSEFQYDERDLLFKATLGFGTSDATTSQFDYDANGRMVTSTNGRGFSTTRTRDLFNRTTRVTNPLGHYVEYAFDKASNLTSVQAFSASAVLLAARTSHFDELNRLWKIERSRFGPGLTPTTPTTTFKRDAGHALLETTDALGRKTTRTVDAAGRVTTVKDAAGNEVTYTLDQAGNATAMERKDVPAVGAPETFRTEFVFDALNRRTTKREIDRLNASNILTTTFEFDSRSNLTFRVDAENNPVRWTYDLASRITDYERALAVGAQIDVFTDAIHETMQYDKVHRLTTVTDDNFNATTYAFDALGRTEKTTFADGKFVTRTFDKNSNVSGWTDQNGSVISHVFDANDRLVQRDIVRGTGVLGPTQELYTYDALNRLTLASDDDYQFSRVFDSVGNLLSESQGYTATGQERWKTVSTGWNSVGASINVTYPSGRKFTHNRDAIDRLLSIVETIPNVAVTTHTWQGVGRKATTTHQNGTMTEYAWDGFARIRAIDHQTPTAQTFHNFEYAYDKAHNRRMEQNSFNATWLATLPTAVQTFLGARNGKGDVYAYDRAYRMVDARYDVTNPQTEVNSPGSQTYAQLVGYTLDGLGNRSQVQTTLWGGAPATTTYASDVVNQYTDVGGVTRTHDSNGNLTDDGTHQYLYDFKNRLVEVKLKSSGATVSTYRYDARGRRVEKDVGGTVTRYILEGVTVVEEFDGTDTWQASYIHGDRIDHPCAMDRADVADVDGDANTTEVLRFHYAQNALGSVSEMTSPSGAVVEWVTYDVYGLPTVRDQNGNVVASSAVGNPFLYTGREWDVEFEKYFYRARTYDPEKGRFLQRDPLGYVDGLGAYEYARSRSAVWIDPTGMWGDVVFAFWAEAEKTYEEYKGIYPKFIFAGPWYEDMDFWYWYQHRRCYCHRHGPSPTPEPDGDQPTGPTLKPLSPTSSAPATAECWHFGESNFPQCGPAPGDSPERIRERLDDARNRRDRAYAAWKKAIEELKKWAVGKMALDAVAEIEDGDIDPDDWGRVGPPERRYGRCSLRTAGGCLKVMGCHEERRARDGEALGPTVQGGV